MSPKFFYLFLIAGFVSLGLMVYDVVSTYPKITATGVLGNLAPAVVLFYLAYKVRKVKEDQELM